MTFQNRMLNLHCMTIAALAGSLLLAAATVAAAAQRPPVTFTAGLQWYTDYARAWNDAQANKKMLLVYFCDARYSAERSALDQYIGRHADVRRQLDDYVRLILPTSATIQIGGRPTRLLSHASFHEMNGREGLAIIDLAHDDAEYYERVVSTFPFMQGKYYRFRPEYLPVILDLPEGTITQRTMTWAVRVHPEGPASTQGRPDPVLHEEAESHSHYQATVRSQGHHRWNTRFHRIRNLLGGIFAPVEVVAESWPGENMLDSCIDCVDSWRQSPGHWNAVRQAHSRYGYDIKRGSNGIWYGTGIFAGYQTM